MVFTKNIEWIRAFMLVSVFQPFITLFIQWAVVGQQKAILFNNRLKTQVISRLIHKSDKTKLIWYILIDHTMISALQSNQA